MTTSVDYYNNHADDFFAGTNEVDMTDVYQRFLPLIPTGGSILDAGCGSGRDARAFMDLGYRVDAFDASSELVDLANRVNGVPATVATFETYISGDLYDGIWACASLLHVPSKNLALTIRNLSSMLKPTGSFYLSFKTGAGERETDGRVFTDMNIDSLSDLLNDLPHLRIRDSWATKDLRPDRNEQWLNAILVKCV